MTGTLLGNLWYVDGDRHSLAAGGILLRDAYVCGGKDGCYLLAEGYGTGQKENWLFGVSDQGVKDLLPDAIRIRFEEDGQITAFNYQGDNLVPLYYHSEGAGLAEWPVSLLDKAELLTYKNGDVVGRRLERLAESAGGSVTWLYRENQMFHAVFTDGAGRESYETYRNREGWLVLTEAGLGGYHVDEVSVE